jgi:heme exporter protein C
MTDDLSIQRTIRAGAAITIGALLAMAGVYYLALVTTPSERWQGEAQKILYLHAPAAWAALMSFSIVGIVSVGYLLLRDRRLDTFAEASAEVGLAFGLVMLTTGPLWGRPVWGSYWQWEPRLTLTLLLVLLFVGYRALRAAIDDPDERARFSAVIGIMALVLVPFVHLSVYLFRTIHPQPVLLKPSKPSMPWEMLRTLLASIVVYTVMYVGFVTMRYGIGRRRVEAST